MAIQWFPGHMHKARKEIAKIMSQVDLIIEVLDARIPFSSENPLVSSLRGETPCIKILNKADLADPEITQRWITYLEKENGVQAIATTTEKPGQIRAILDLCRRMMPHKTSKDLAIHTMIMGIPNVGKSTIINILAGRMIAKTGNQPALTREQQKINLKNGVFLSDTPGILWPKLEPETCGYRLAVTGAIRDTAIEYEDVAMFAAGYLLHAYPDRLIKRYQFEALPDNDLQLLEEIGRRRGALQARGHINLHKASEILLNELRNGTLGAISMETPEMMEAEREALAKLKEEKAAEKAARKQAWKSKR